MRTNLFGERPVPSAWKSCGWNPTLRGLGVSSVRINLDLISTRPSVYRHLSWAVPALVAA
jgi:hypothetical protein